MEVNNTMLQETFQDTKHFIDEELFPSFKKEVGQFSKLLNQLYLTIKGKQVFYLKDLNLKNVSFRETLVDMIDLKTPQTEILENSLKHYCELIYYLSSKYRLETDQIGNHTVPLVKRLLESIIWVDYTPGDFTSSEGTLFGRKISAMKTRNPFVYSLLGSFLEEIAKQQILLFGYIEQLDDFFFIDYFLFLREQVFSNLKIKREDNTHAYLLSPLMDTIRKTIEQKHPHVRFSKEQTIKCLEGYYTITTHTLTKRLNRIRYFLKKGKGSEETEDLNNPSSSSDHESNIHHYHGAQKINNLMKQEIAQAIQILLRSEEEHQRYCLTQGSWFQKFYEFILRLFGFYPDKNNYTLDLGKRKETVNIIRLKREFLEIIQETRYYLSHFDNRELPRGERNVPNYLSYCDNLDFYNIRIERSLHLLRKINQILKVKTQPQRKQKIETVLRDIEKINETIRNNQSAVREFRMRLKTEPHTHPINGSPYSSVPRNEESFPGVLDPESENPHKNDKSTDSPE